ncbi:uncharacterized protein LOC135217172 isoform X2 [Macrobrachium nipponense]|uniref:uncharacterized protein LOC135217172 isoform X2 n=1 Tax=Macrobrachium nipponense TaxID=159736 RepID=UPI0030C891BC
MEETIPINMDIPTDEDSIAPVVVSQESSPMMRIYFIFLLSVALAATYFLWRKMSSVDKERELSLRGELLLNIFIFLDVYCFSWIPILLIGAIDGQLETASVSTSFKGHIANLHCSLQDLLVRTFCMSVVLSSAVYIRYARVKTSQNCCCGRPSIFVWGTFIPAVVIEISRKILEQEEWLMPTKSITRYLSSVKFSVETTPAFCVQMMDASWLRQVMAEWFLTTVLVVTAVYCLSSCFSREEDSKDSNASAKSKSGQSSDSEAEDYTELQMESLLETGAVSSERLDGSPSDQSKAKSLKPNVEQPEEGLYVRGSGFLEAIICIGVLWAVLIRPFMAITMYIRHTETYSNHLDMPTHVLLVIAIAVLPAELMSKRFKEKTEDKKSEKLTKQDEATSVEEKDEDIIWIVDEDKGTAYALRKDDDGDVDPIWVHSEKDKRIDNKLTNSSSVHDVSTAKETQASPK